MGYIYNAALSYKNFVDTGVTVVHAGSACMGEVVNTVASGVNLGAKESLKKCAKWSLGFHDYKKAVLAFPKRAPHPLPNHLMAYDDRTMEQRVGESIGHIINGSTKAVTTATFGVLASATVFGTLSNLVLSDAQATNDFHIASRLLATGVFKVSACCAKVGSRVASLGFQIFKPIFSAAVNNPKLMMRISTSGAALYGVSYGIVNAANAKSVGEKVAYYSLTLLSLSALGFINHRTIY